MANFSYEFNVEDLDNGQKAYFVELTGSIDPESFESFQAMFDELQAKDALFIAINFDGLTYINSTGMGLMVQVTDGFTSKGGEILLMRIPPKVMLVMEMLGLQEFFKIVNDEKQAKEAFAGKKVEGATVEAKLKTEDAAETPPAAEDTQDSISCQSCNAKLSVNDSGCYKCPRCRALFKVSSDSSVEFYQEKNNRSIELVVPADESFLPGIGELLMNCSSEGNNNSGPVFAAVRSSFMYLTKQALEGDKGKNIQLLIDNSNGSLNVSIYSAGKDLGLSGKDITSVDELSESAENVDKFEYKSINNGNLFFIEKE
ncbi:MAG: STAS domain-containing protein [Planctomycetota bacterium]|jgi:anti-anti-sigma factor